MDYTKRTKHQQLVDELMVKASQELPTEPTIPGPEVRLLRSKLMGEEYLETTIDGLAVQPYIEINLLDLEISGKSVDANRIEFPINKDTIKFKHKGEPNLKEIVDGCGDESVVTIGTLSACGVNDHSILMAIDENNLKKFGPGGYRREDGKWMKPPDHQPPDIDAILENQRLGIKTFNDMDPLEDDERLGYIIAEFIQNRQTSHEIRNALINILKLAGLQK